MEEDMVQELNYMMMAQSMKEAGKMINIMVMVFCMKKMKKIGMKEIGNVVGEKVKVYK
jgi:hypothetical protein